MGSSVVLCASAVLILLCVGLGRAEEETTASPSYEAVQQYYQQLAQLAQAQLVRAQANYYHDDNQAQNQQGVILTIFKLCFVLCPSPASPLSHANSTL